jgi:UDP-N-acetylglucosamine 1-carboxyvinyltransferase
LGRFLVSLGARIEGLGTEVIEIVGVESLGGALHRVIADRIEAATLLVAGAISAAVAGESTIRACGVVPDDLTTVLDALSATGAEISQGPDWVALRATGRPRPVDLVAAPFPGLPTDVQAQLTALLTLALGRSTVRDRVFSERFGHAASLRQFGAMISVGPGRATIDGRDRLHGATVVASDLRASAALVLAGLAAHGRSTVRRIDHLDRGYESLDCKLRTLGAIIERVPEPAFLAERPLSAAG